MSRRICPKRELVSGLIRRCFDDRTPTGATSQATIKNFVGYLGQGLEAAYESEPDVIALWEGNPEHRKSMGMNELLFDVTVCRVIAATSPMRSAELSAVSGVLWSVESEFARNSRESIFDFNKLVFSTAENKLFVAPFVEEKISDSYRASLGIAADFCIGNVFLTQVPHPADWDKSNSVKIPVWERREGAWRGFCQNSVLNRRSGRPEYMIAPCI